MEDDIQTLRLERSGTKHSRMGSVGTAQLGSLPVSGHFLEIGWRSCQSVREQRDDLRAEQIEQSASLTVPNEMSVTFVARITSVVPVEFSLHTTLAAIPVDFSQTHLAIPISSKSNCRPDCRHYLDHVRRIGSVRMALGAD